MFLFHGYREGTSHMRALSSASGEKHEGKSDLLASAVCSDSFHLKYSVYQDTVFGVTCPEPHSNI